MDNQITDNDVSNCLQALIELGGINAVDNTPDKYIRSADDSSKLATLPIEGKDVPLAIYGTKSAEAIIINPFAEGQAGEARNIWFYSSRNVILGGIIRRILRELLKIGAEAHSKKKNAPTPSLVAIKYLEGSVDDIDDKMLKEYDTVTKDLKDFLVIYYNKSKKRSEVSCILKNKARRKQFTSVRTKTWNTLETLINKVLGTDDLETFAESATTNGIPVLETYVKVLVKVYKAIEEPAQVIGKTFPQLAELESHIKYLPQYYTKARWCVDPTSATAAAPAPAVATAPWVATNVATGNFGVPVSNAVPGVPMAAAPTYVPQPTYQYGGVPMAQPYAQSAPAVPGVPNLGGVPLNGTTCMDMARQQYQQSLINAQMAYGIPQQQAPQPTYKSDNPFARP